jgi:hypothetical protein
MRWTRHVTRVGRKRKKEYRGLMGKLEGKRPLGTCRPMWEYNIKIDLK